MLFRVKRLSDGFHLLDVQLGKTFLELLEHHLKTLAVGRFLVRVLGNAALQIIVHTEHAFDRVDLGVGVDRFFFLGGALAVVVILGGKAQIFVLLVGKGFRKTLHLLHLLFREREGLLRRLLLCFRFCFFLFFLLSPGFFGGRLLRLLFLFLCHLLL